MCIPRFQIRRFIMNNLPITLANKVPTETAGEEESPSADSLAKNLFENSSNPKMTADTIAKFVKSYGQKKGNQSLHDWLIGEFDQYPDIWDNPGDAQACAEEIISAIHKSNATKESLDKYISQGKSRESWLGIQIDSGAEAAGINDIGAYASKIDHSLKLCNKRMMDTILTKDGVVSQAFNLDGFIAEQHHVNTFNIEASVQKSGYTARVLSPEPGTPFRKNTVDIGIYDPAGKLVKRYQSKYGATADTTQQLFERGDYPGQGKLVPADQVGDISNATSVIEINGISSKPLTKAEAKELQQKAQNLLEIKKYEWTDANRGKITKEIGKQALIAAGCVAAFQGARILGRRMWNALRGKENPTPNEDFREFFESALKSSTQVGIQVAVSGAVMVAAKSGCFGAALRYTPAGRIANMVFVGLENAKILYKVCKGELSETEALDEMGNVTCGLIGSLAGAAEGASIGAAIGVIAGPIGIALGGIVGGIVGGMAGNAIGEGIYSAGKTIVTTATKILRSVWEGAKVIGQVLIPEKLFT